MEKFLNIISRKSAILSVYIISLILTTIGLSSLSGDVSAPQLFTVTCFTYGAVILLIIITEFNQNANKKLVKEAYEIIQQFQQGVSSGGRMRCY